MKKKLLSFIFAICLIVPCAVIFTACDIFKEEHKCVATETYDHDASQHWFKCEDTDCDEKLSVEDHEFDDGVLEETTKIYTCICGYKTEEHICKSVYKYTDREHWKRCEDDTCNLGSFYDGRWLHTFEYEFIAVENGYNTVTSCECGVTKTTQVITFNNSTDGVIEVIERNVYLESLRDEVNNKKRVVFMAKPNKEKYFLKWEVKTLGKIDGYTRNVDIYETPTISYDYGFIQYPTWDYVREYTPIFTNSVEDVVYYDVHITGQNDLEHGVYYLPYYAAEMESPKVNFYIKSNENLMLEDVHVVEDTSNQVVNMFGNGDENIPLPYVTKLGTDGLPIGDLYIRLIDLRDKVVIKAGSIIPNGDVAYTYKYFVAERGEKISVYSDNGDNYYSYISGWQNEDGEIISDRKVLDVVAENSITYYAIMESADFDDFWYACVLNDDNTYTIERCSITNKNATIPEIINGIRVSAIAENAFAYNSGIFHVVIPAGITNIEDDAFAHIDTGCSIKIEGDRDNLTLDMFAYCNGANSMLISITEQTIKNMISNLVDTFIEDADLEVVFEPESHFNGEFAHYESGTRKICLPEVAEDSVYTVGALWVWAHEIRHFYQFIAIGAVEGLDKTDLLVQPTNEQIAGWQTTYPDPSVDYEAYWNHPLEVDARDFATQLMGFNFNG